MTMHCPSCNKRINPLKVKPYFACAICETELEGRIFAPSLIAFAIASLIDWLMVDSIYAYAGSGWWPGFALRMLINTVIYFFINMGLLMIMGKVIAAKENIVESVD